MRHWRWYSRLLLALLVAGFALYVWPTRYAWYPVDGRPYMLRRDRLTGDCLFVKADSPKSAQPAVEKIIRDVYRAPATNDSEEIIRRAYEEAGN